LFPPDRLRTSHDPADLARRRPGRSALTRIPSATSGFYPGPCHTLPTFARTPSGQVHIAAPGACLTG